MVTHVNIFAANKRKTNIILDCNFMNELQNIKLPDFLITDWYKSHLIISEENKVVVRPAIPENKKEIPAPINEPIWFVGYNKKNITIVIDQNVEVVISDDWKAFLNSVITACKLTLNDVVVVNLHMKKISYTDIKTKFNSQFLLLFDISPGMLGIPAVIPHYEIRVDNNCSIIFSDSISQMLPNTPEAKQIKMKLWVSLKKMFNV